MPKCFLFAWRSAFLGCLIHCVHCRSPEEDGFCESHADSLEACRILSVSLDVRTDRGMNVAVVSPAGSDQSLDLLLEWCVLHRKELRSAVFSAKSVLLFRGWDIQVQHAEQLIFDAIAFGKMQKYPQWFVDFNVRAQRLGVPPSNLTQRELSRNVPKPVPKSIQAPHIEFGFGPRRPRVCAFHCEIPPAAEGETALIYLPDAFSSLSNELRLLLETCGWWHHAVGFAQPSVLEHPETGLKTLQLYAFTDQQARLFVRAWDDVRKTSRPDFPEVDAVIFQVSPSVPEDVTLVTNSSERFLLAEEHLLEIFRAMLSSVWVHAYERGDVLIFDNVLYGHFRMPSSGGPRMLNAIFAEEVDTRTLRPANAPDIVHRHAAKVCLGSAETVLTLIGPGGSYWVLQTLMLLPDFAFRWAGLLLWA
ncbi:unnamed protein product [Prorocentrum cordatum]|uniref:TauD/TfdA-like domain-containing protein n=1 Tax=Prorocentrum cordatum TaxID=2364126 RepID=A0ABN9PYF3_9DINO|nr:unnamed protein product [Polarella glacialis]